MSGAILERIRIVDLSWGLAGILADAGADVGAILNVSSIGSWQAQGIYSLTKLAVNGLTVNLVHELAADNIRVRTQLHPAPWPPKGCGR